jgi:hypothetical protein
VEPSPVDPIAVEVELDVLAEVLAELAVELLDGVAIRLVEAWSAADRLVPLEDEEELVAFEDDALDVTDTAGLLVEAVLLWSRPNPERLPRMEGLRSDAKFSAAVTPVRRMVASRVPEVTVAVRIAADATGLP